MPISWRHPQGRKGRALLAQRRVRSRRRTEKATRGREVFGRRASRASGATQTSAHRARGYAHRFCREQFSYLFRARSTRGPRALRRLRRKFRNLSARKQRAPGGGAGFTKLFCTLISSCRAPPGRCGGPASEAANARDRPCVCLKPRMRLRCGERGSPTGTLEARRSDPFTAERLAVPRQLPIPDAGARCR